MEQMRVNDLFYWISERWSIYTKKDAKLTPPWTDDKILQRYSFCNVHRENDAVTKWIRENWRQPHNDDPNLWFNMVIARLLNLPSSLMALGYTDDWNPNHFKAVLADLRGRGKNIFNSAYIVSTNGRSMDKVDYLAEHVLTPLWENRAGLQPVRSDSLERFYEKLRAFNGMGSFMAAQVVADIKYASPFMFILPGDGKAVPGAIDWWTFAASGPGSRRGLNRVLNYDVDSRWSEPFWLRQLHELQAAIDPLVENAHIPRIHAQDLQNCLCEFDKYERARLNQGRPKKSYRGW